MKGTLDQQSGCALAWDDVRLRPETELDAERQLGMSCGAEEFRLDGSSTAGNQIDQQDHNGHDQQ